MSAASPGVAASNFRLDPWVSAVIRRMPEPLDAGLRRWCYPAFLMARNRRLTLTHLHGAVNDVEVKVVVAGPEPWASDLPRRMFVESPARSDGGEVVLWKAEEALRELSETADLIFARVDSLSARLFFGPGYLRIPEWVDTVLRLPVNLDTLVRSNKSLREDMRVLKHNPMEATVSEREEDFELFYDSMYVPFIRARHGMLAWPSNRESLRKCFRRGGLIWVGREGERVAGILFEMKDGVLHLPAEGTRGGDVGLLKKGAVSRLFYQAIRLGMDRGCGMVDFGGCRPCLRDGVLRYKQKWGMDLRSRPTNQFWTLVGWKRWNAAVEAFLSAVPVLHQDRSPQGGWRLTAIAASGGTDGCEWTRMQGIDRIAIANGTPLPEELTR